MLDDWEEVDFLNLNLKLCGHIAFPNQLEETFAACTHIGWLISCFQIRKTCSFIIKKHYFIICVKNAKDKLLVEHYCDYSMKAFTVNKVGQRCENTFMSF